MGSLGDWSIATNKTGYNYILTVVDVCTAYIVLQSLENKNMECVARKLWEVFTDYETPKILQSDNGAEFVNKIIDAFTILHEIEPRLNVAYNPRTNGLVERRNKDISKALKKFIESAYGRWDDWLPMVQISLNQALSRRTGLTVF